MNITNARYTSEDLNVVDVDVAHPEHGLIPYTFMYDTDDESLDGEVRAALEGLEIAAYVPYVMSTDEVNAQQIKLALASLKETDWVVVKIAEKSVSGEDVALLLAQYSEVLESRRADRALINQLENT